MDKFFKRVHEWQVDYFDNLLAYGVVAEKLATFGLIRARLDWVTMGVL